MDDQNMRYYNAWREVPKNAQREIKAGRLKGKTDINPLWRIKSLTEMYGPCGIGWKTSDERYIPLKNDATGEVAIICQLNLQYKENGSWSAPVFGVGGSMLIALEAMYDADGKKYKGLYLNDEAYKMAHTDALSVACKQLGMGASVYWSADNTKYSQGGQTMEQPSASVNVTPQPVKKPESPSPVTVEKTATVYNPKEQINAIKRKYGVDDEGFKRIRQTLILGGCIEDIPSSKMTEADWQQLFRAIEVNFPLDEAGGAT